MKKLILLILGLILTWNVYSQISFEKGYYITNSGTKIDCLIKNNDWKNNPQEFEYRITNNEKTQVIEIKLVKEFGIYNVSKYVRATVKIDQSTDNINTLTTNKNPVFNEEELFLKVLIEGKAILFYYENKRLIRYFFSFDNSSIEQLTYKRYKTENSSIRVNNNYKQQLWNSLKCSEITISDIEKLEYKKKKLVHFFSKYNMCCNSEFVDYETYSKNDLLIINIRPRLRYSSLTYQNIFKETIDMGTNLGFGFGIETEIVLPFNKGKWTVILEPTYQYFIKELVIDARFIKGGKLITKVEYQSIEIPIGVRHYFYLGKDSKIFINVSYLFDITNQPTINRYRIDDSLLGSLDISTTSNFAFGLGYKLNNKYSLEINYQTSREVLKNYIYQPSEYKTFSVILGYTLF